MCALAAGPGAGRWDVCVCVCVCVKPGDGVEGLDRKGTWGVILLGGWGEGRTVP